MARGQVITLDEAASSATWQEYFRLLDGKRTTYLTECNKFKNFTYGNQYSPTEISDMEDRGQYPAKINRSLKYITTLVGMMTAGSPMFKAYPSGIEDNNMSYICNLILTHVFKRSGGSAVISKALTAGYGTNIGYVVVGQDEKNATTMWFYPVEDVVISRDSKDSLFRDAESIYIHKWMTVKAAAKMYGIDEKDISLDAPDGIEFYYSGPNSERTVVESNLYDDTQNYVKVVEGMHRVVMREMVDGQWTGRSKIKMIKKTMIGFKHAFVEELPDSITEHCVIPVYAYDTENIFKQGLMSRLYDYQRLLNKSFSILLLNAQLASNPKVFVWEGQIPNDDIDAFSDNYAQPGSINLLSGMGGKDAQVPVIVQGLPLSNAWYSFVDMMMKELEFSALPNQLLGMDMQQGNRAAHLMEQYTVTIESIRTFLNIFDNFMAQLGKVVLQYFSTYTLDDNVANRLFNLDTINKEINAARQKQIPEDEAAQQEWMNKQVEATGSPRTVIEAEVMKYKKNLGILKSITDITESPDFTDFDIEVVKGSYLPASSMLQFYQKLELLNLGAIDVTELLKEAPIENKEEVIARMDTVRKLTSEVEQLMLNGEKVSAELEATQKELIKKEMEMQLAEGKFKIDKEYTQTRAKNSAMTKIQKAHGALSQQASEMDRKEKFNEVMLQIKEALMEYKLANSHGMQKEGLPSVVEVDQLIEEIMRNDNGQRNITE